MPFIEIITDAKSQIQLSRLIQKDIVNNADIMYIKEKNIDNIKNIKLDTLIIGQSVENTETISKIIYNTRNLILNLDLNENLLNDLKTTNKGNSSNSEQQKLARLISFGYSSKSDITVSSVEEDELLICIQNTIVSIYGRKIEPQEIKVNVKPDINMYNIMIIIALTSLYAK